MNKPQRDLLFRTLTATFLCYYIAPSLSFIVLVPLSGLMNHVNTQRWGDSWMISFVYLLIVGFVSFLSSGVVLSVIYRSVFKLRHYLLLAFVPQLVIFLLQYVAIQLLTVGGMGPGFAFLGYGYMLLPLISVVLTLYLLITKVELPAPSKSRTKPLSKSSAR